MTAPNHKPLTVTLPPYWAEIVRSYGRARGHTWESEIFEAIRVTMANGGPTVLAPYGEPLACDNNQPTSAHLQVILSDGGINDR